MLLTEKYKKRINISETFYAKQNNGAQLTKDQKILLAQVLENTNNYNNYLKEAYGQQSVSTQLSDTGFFHKFAMDITTLALPNLILPELVKTQAIDDFNGYERNVSLA